MLEKLRNLLLKTFKKPHEDAAATYLFGLIFILFGYKFGNIFIKIILYTAGLANVAICVAASYVHTYRIKEERNERNTKFYKTKNTTSEENNTNTKGLRGRNRIVINAQNEVTHISLDTYINNINFTEYLIMTIGYPGYEEDLKRLDFFKVFATPNTEQETLDNLDLSLNELKNEVTDKIQEYCEYINREPKTVRRRYRK